MPDRQVKLEVRSIDGTGKGEKGLPWGTAARGPSMRKVAFSARNHWGNGDLVNPLWWETTGFGRSQRTGGKTTVR